MIAFSVACLLSAGYAVSYAVHAALRRRAAPAFGAAVLAAMALLGAAACLLVR